MPEPEETDDEKFARLDPTFETLTQFMKPTQDTEDQDETSTEGQEAVEDDVDSTGNSGREHLISEEAQVLGNSEEKPPTVVDGSLPE